ncbi:MAG: hypothetical protein H7301_03900 [Cryobacterium sp.]|nr:hypothetical protein [Oligoflexia bacterium]
MKLRIFAVLILFSVISTSVAATDPSPEPSHSAITDIIATYPHLDQYLFKESDTKVRFGFGVSPFHVVKSKAGFSLSLFQVHYTTPTMDWEVFNADFGTTLSGDAFAKTNTFHFRTFPKWRITPKFSVGPLLGFEFLSFPEVKAQITRAGYATLEQPLSARGWVYGVGASQVFNMGEQTRAMRINEVVYKQNYNIHQPSAKGWEYLYSNSALNRDSSIIEPGMVFAIEISFLY